MTNHFCNIYLRSIGEHQKGRICVPFPCHQADIVIMFLDKGLFRRMVIILQGRQLVFQVHMAPGRRVNDRAVGQHSNFSSSLLRIRSNGILEGVIIRSAEDNLGFHISALSIRLGKHCRIQLINSTNLKEELIHRTAFLFNSHPAVPLASPGIAVREILKAACLTQFGLCGRHDRFTRRNFT